jgi:hypothetical protein
MSRSQKVRFGLGWWDGLRSSTWSVSSGKDSSVYVASRDIGHALKASLHPRDVQRPGGEWRVAWTSEHVAKGLNDPSRRVLDQWDSEEARLDVAPLKQGFAVVLGRFSLGLHPLPEEPNALAAYRGQLSKVQWLDEIPELDKRGSSPFWSEMSTSAFWGRPAGVQ